MNNPRTSQTIAFNLRQLIAGTEPGAQKKTYPNGPGTRPVMAPLTDEERESDRRDAWDTEQEWFAVDPRGARAWIDAGRDANPERYSTR